MYNKVVLLSSYFHTMQLHHRHLHHQSLVPSMTSLLPLLRIANLNTNAHLQTTMTKPRMNPLLLMFFQP